MSDTLLRDLEDRKRQVRHYLMTVVKAERATDLGSSTRTQEGRLLTLRAGSFLILYNLVEATMRSAIEAIHDKITTSEVEFTRLRLSIRKLVIVLFKRIANPDKNHTMPDFPSEFVAVALALNQGIKMSGSVDARAIRELGDRYGFSCKTGAYTRDGSDLLIVKTNRNDLAHGVKTFEEVGRNYTVHELLLLSRRTMQFMTEITNNVASYINTEAYLE